MRIALWVFVEPASKVGAFFSPEIHATEAVAVAVHRSVAEDDAVPHAFGIEFDFVPLREDGFEALSGAQVFCNDAGRTTVHEPAMLVRGVKVLADAVARQ